MWNGGDFGFARVKLEATGKAPHLVGCRRQILDLTLICSICALISSALAETSSMLALCSWAMPAML